MSGMRINFHKCDLIAINVEEEEAQTIAQSLYCRLGKFPMKYLGVPLHYKKLRKEDLQPVIDKILKKAAGWRGRLLNHAAKLELVRSVLASIPLYLLSVIKFPKWALALINSQMAHCFGIIMRDITNTTWLTRVKLLRRKNMVVWVFLI
jgi:hypothetical protein